MKPWRGSCRQDEDTPHSLECVIAGLESHSDVLSWEMGQDLCHCDCHQDCPWRLVLYAPMIRLYTWKATLGEETYD